MDVASAIVVAVVVVDVKRFETEYQIYPFFISPFLAPEFVQNTVMQRYTEVFFRQYKNAILS